MSKSKNTNQLEFNFIKHEIENQLICQRSADGYVNATAMCKAAGKEWSNYKQLESTKEFIVELSSSLGIPRTALVCTIQGGFPQPQGTYVHPQVAVNLGQWLSPKFAVKVSKWILDWYNKPKEATQPRLPYHLRRYELNRNKIPHTHFSVFQEIVMSLIAPLESAGYDLPENLVPDISQGLMFAKFIRDLGIDTDSLPTYKHRYEDGRVVNAKFYPMKYISIFKEHFLRVWMKEKSEKYFEKRGINIGDFLVKIIELGEKLENKYISYN